MKELGRLQPAKKKKKPRLIYVVKHFVETPAGPGTLTLQKVEQRVGPYGDLVEGYRFANRVAGEFQIQRGQPIFGGLEEVDCLIKKMRDLESKFSEIEFQSELRARGLSEKEIKETGENGEITDEDF